MTATERARLKAADDLAKAVELHGHLGHETRCAVCDKLKVYKKLRGEAVTTSPRS